VLGKRAEGEPRAKPELPSIQPKCVGLGCVEPASRRRAEGGPACEQSEPGPPEWLDYSPSCNSRRMQ
jgi:hypothetical protein